MTLYTNVSNVWKSAQPSVNVSGVWKPVVWSVNNSGTWKTIYAPIPAGLIIMSADGSTPSGWTRYSAADGYFIVGAGSAYSANGTGGSSTPIGTVESSSNGGHAGSSHGVIGTPSGVSNNPLCDENIGGAHTHMFNIIIHSC